MLIMCWCHYRASALSVLQGLLQEALHRLLAPA